LERELIKVYYANKDDWDERVQTILWAYNTTTKKLHNYTPFQLVYGRKATVLDDFITPRL